MKHSQHAATPDFAQLLQSGIEHHKAGNLPEAENTYHEILASQPNHCDAIQYLGMLSFQKGNAEKALELFERAIVLLPSSPMLHYKKAIVLENTGQVHAAAESYHKAISLKPDYVEAHVNLGNILQNQGEIELAIEHFQKALHFNPQFIYAHVNLGLAFQKMGQFSEALESQNRAIEINPQCAEAYSNKGNVLKTLGQTEEAADAYNHALQIRPHFHEAQIGLSIVLLDQGYLDDAEIMIHEVLGSNPNLAKAQNTLGSILFAKGRLEDAAMVFNNAIESNPNYADAICNLGNVYSMQHQSKKAAECYHQALAIKPEFATAHLHLTLVESSASPDSKVSIIEDLLNQSSISDSDRISLSFALGNLHHQQRQYNKAFEFYSAGNRLNQSRIPQNLDDEYAMIQCMKDSFNDETIQNETSLNSEEPIPIFIIGMPRSGKTLVERFLEYRSDFQAGGELDLIPRIADLLVQESNISNFWENISQLDETLAKNAAKIYLDHLKELAPGAKYVTDTLPGNYIYIGLIRKLFPNAKIIECVRNPLDNCLACYFRYFAFGHFYSNDLEELGQYYNAYHDLMKYWKQVMPYPILSISYEEILADTDVILSRVRDYISDEESLSELEKVNSKQVHKLYGSQLPELHTKELRFSENYKTYLESLIKVLGAAS